MYLKATQRIHTLDTAISVLRTLVVDLHTFVLAAIVIEDRAGQDPAACQHILLDHAITQRNAI